MTYKRLVLTGSRPPNAAQVQRLAERQIDVIYEPSIVTVPVAFELPPALDWLVVTSPTGVERIVPHLPQLRATKIAVVGTKTARVLERAGRSADFIPSAFTGDVLVDELQHQLLPNQRICFARGNRSRQEPLERLKQVVAADVLEVVTYETNIRQIPRERLSGATYIGLQSPSAVEALASLALETSATYVAIGPVTEQAARRAGLRPLRSAKTFTLDGLIDCILEEELE
ncbi:uroporphyrinogen-III synthase [Exiguobacterium sp. s193]|uniref:uroporphyrinogen-III synthase n=1 Tax=Exiguobacterium sp. s193 TaxID=2751207 RepID=UPI001BE97EF4|nr:uroporphyrinogen-III synthase [Exiguobacterium sp. s193]